MMAADTPFGLQHADTIEPSVPARIIARVLALSAQGAMPNELAAVFGLNEQTVISIVRGRLCRSAHDQLINMGKVNYTRAFGDAGDSDKLAGLRENKE
jgi:hypothetical protein